MGHFVHELTRFVIVTYHLKMKKFKDLTVFSRRTMVQFTAFSFFFKGLFVSLGKSSEPYKRTIQCTSNKNLTCFASEEEFWNDHKDFVAYELNSLFRHLGWITKDATKLSNDGKSVYLTKEYKSKQHHEIYTRAWNWLSKGQKKEHEFIAYQESSKHLF